VIILDTCVVSEALTPGRDPALIEWLDRQSAETLYLTATSLSELLMGVNEIADGKRKNQIRSALDLLIDRLFSSRILPFDHLAALSLCSLLNAAKSGGTDVTNAVATIAAVASVHGFVVATRDCASFESLGVQTTNPWTAG